MHHREAAILRAGRLCATHAHYLAYRRLAADVMAAGVMRNSLPLGVS
jgi:hypothetical protein